MTKMYIRIFLFIVSTSAIVLACKKDPITPPATSNVDLKKGLLLYLPFDGNMADSSGNGNLTTVIGGGALTYDEHGYANNAYGSTGNGETLVVTNNGSIKFDTSLSISYDFMIRGFGRQSFLSMVNQTTGHSPSFVTGTNTPGSTHFSFGVIDSSSGCGNWGMTSEQNASDTTGFEPQLESWYNVVCTYHRGTIQTFINGKLISTKTGLGTRAQLCAEAQIVVGGWWAQDPISINGKMDEIRIYNRILNADEIAELSKEFQNN
jgi:hypothetical protein